MYRSTPSLTSALDGVGGQRHAPAALPLRKTRYPLYRRLGGPQGRSGRVRKFSPLPTVQPVASHYTDRTIPAHDVTLKRCLYSVLTSSYCYLRSPDTLVRLFYFFQNSSTFQWADFGQKGKSRETFNIVMRRLTTGMRSEKCVVRRFRRCAKVIQCTYTNVDSGAHYTPSLYGIAYCC